MEKSYISICQEICIDEL